MVEPTERDHERSKAYRKALAEVSTLEAELRVVARALADERARNVAWLRDLATRPPHADVNPRAFALQVECIRTAAHLLERGAADALEADHE